MAEVIGIVAGGIAFAEFGVKVGQCTLTLKEMWDDIKDVPETIRDLLERIELYEPVVAEMESVFSSPYQDNVGRQIATFCRSAYDNLSTSVYELSSELGCRDAFKRRKAKMKVSLKRNVWLKIETRLSRTVQMLELAQQLYMTSLIKQQPQLLLSELQAAKLLLGPSSKCLSAHSHCGNSRNSRSASGALINTFTSNHDPGLIPPAQWRGPSFLGGMYFSPEKPPSGEKRRQEESLHVEATRYLLQIRPPSWLTRKAWDILISKSYSGFNFYLRSYNIVPSNSAVFDLAREGDIEGLMRLFDTGMASPFDTSEYGRTILDTGAEVGSMDVISKAVSWGLDMSMLFDCHMGGVMLFLGLTSALYGPSSLDVRAFHDLALATHAYERAAEMQSRDPLHQLGTNLILNGNGQAMQLMVAHLSPNHYQSRAPQRIEVFCPFKAFCDADCFLYALQPRGQLIPDDIFALEQEGFVLPKLLAPFYQRCLELNAGCKGGWTYRPGLIKWRSVMQEVMKVTSLLHSLTHSRNTQSNRRRCKCQYVGTPMINIIQPNWLYLDGRWTFSIWRRHVEHALRLWLEDIAISGIDLISYGKVEFLIYSNSKDSRSLRFGVGVCDDCRCRKGATWSLESFTYGSQPQEWKFIWDMGVERFVGEFWQMVESPWLRMTGAWVD